MFHVKLSKMYLRGQEELHKGNFIFLHSKFIFMLLHTKIYLIFVLWCSPKLEHVISLPYYFPLQYVVYKC